MENQLSDMIRLKEELEQEYKTVFEYTQLNNSLPFDPSYGVDLTLEELRDYIAELNCKIKIWNMCVFFNKLIKKCGDFEKLQRVVAWCLRFKNNALKKGQRMSGPLTKEEKERAFVVLIRLDQYNTFPNEVAQLYLGNEWPYWHMLGPCGPVLGWNGLLKYDCTSGNSSCITTIMYIVMYRFSVLLSMLGDKDVDDLLPSWMSIDYVD